MWVANHVNAFNSPDKLRTPKLRGASDAATLNMLSPIADEKINCAVHCEEKTRREAACLESFQLCLLVTLPFFPSVILICCLDQTNQTIKVTDFSAAVGSS